MGCLFSKKSTVNKDARTSKTTRVQQLGNSTSNGIIRVAKIHVKKKDTNREDDVNSHELRMRPPPPAPPPSPPAFIETPRETTKSQREVTKPQKSGTPETPEEKQILQDAEDLEPVTPLTTGRSHTPFDDKQSTNTRVSVSSVSVKTSATGLNRPGWTADVSVEELDTDMDDFNKISGKRYSFRKGEKINPATTDILLPRRKEPSEPANDKDDKMQSGVPTAGKAIRDDTPMPKTAIMKPKLNLNKKPDGVPRLVLEDAEEESEDQKKENSKPEVVLTHLDVNNEREENILTFDESIDIREVKNHDITTKAPKETQEEPHVARHGDKAHTVSDIKFETTELPSDSKSIPTPKNIYDKELQKERLKRKRKRDRKPDSSKRRGHSVDRDGDVFLEGSLKQTLKNRPGSAASTWTMDSKKSLGSTDTLHSFDLETETDRRERYSYLDTGTTPISFKSYVVDGNAEIIDLEDTGGDPNDDSWLTDDRNESRKDEKFDVWYGMKPYDVVTSVGRKDSGVVAAASGPSSSDTSTKHKLIYSRFARRPQSESVLGNSRPPKPPANVLKTRPVSDTVRKSNQMNQYFTTDLDIH